MPIRGHKSRQLHPSFLLKGYSIDSGSSKRTFPVLPPPYGPSTRKKVSQLWCGTAKPAVSQRIKIMNRLSACSLPNLPGHVLRADPGALRAIAALLSGLQSRSESGLFQNCWAWQFGAGLLTQVPNQTDPVNPGFNSRRLTMNRIMLIGFLGSDATPLNTNNSSFTVLSLATKSFYKDKKTGEYKGSTEWHRCIVWGKLSDFARTLTKGAHLAVEGELRSREREDKRSNAKQRIWEVRVFSILKLDRAEKAAPEPSKTRTASRRKRPFR